MTIAVLGAGDVGAAAAHQLAACDVASRVVLVDGSAAVAAGKALDMAQAAPVGRFSTRLSGTDDLTVVTGAAVLVLADETGPGGEWRGDAGLALLRRVASWNADAPIVCAGAQQADVIDLAVGELGLARTRVFGSAPEALRASVAALVALEADTAPADVSIMVVGRAPGAVIVPWDMAAIAGRRVVDVLSPPALTRLETRIARVWPPGPTALGGAAARIVRSMLTKAPRTHAVQVTPPREGDWGRRSAILPARLHPRGVLRVEAPALSSRDRVRFETTLAR